MEEFNEVEIKEEKTCDNCNEKISLFNKNKVIKDLYICDKCASTSGITRHLKEIKGFEKDLVLKIIKEKIEKHNSFNPSFELDKYIAIDEAKKLFTVPYLTGLTKSTINYDPACIFALDKIRGYSLFEDDNLIASYESDKKEKNIQFAKLSLDFNECRIDCDRGKISSLRLVLHLDSRISETVSIDFIKSSTKKDSSKYYEKIVQAMRIMAIIKLIINTK